MEEVKAEIDKLLKSLRSCDTQATAIAWMTRAYKAMEQCLPYLEAPKRSMIFVPERPQLQIVQEIPKAYNPTLFVNQRRLELQNRSNSQTVVYPDFFMHPGLKPKPKAWTHEDTLRLERAAKARDKPLIQRLGK